MSTFWFVRGSYSKAAQVAQKLLAIAHRQRTSGAELDACLLIAGSKLWLGELQQAGELLERSIALYQPDPRTGHSLLHCRDPRVSAFGLWALNLWHLGDTKGAMAKALQSEACAGDLNDPFTLACALTHKLLLYRLRRDVAALSETAQSFAVISTE